MSKKVIQFPKKNVSELHESLNVIAECIILDWSPKISEYAAPYLEAMLKLDQITDMYGLDTAESIVLYFLANAQTWKGEVAREKKKQLKAIVDMLNKSERLRLIQQQNHERAYQK